MILRLKLIRIIYKASFCISQRTLYFPSIKTNQWKVYRKTVAVYCENYTKQMYINRKEKNAKFCLNLAVVAQQYYNFNWIPSTPLFLGLLLINPRTVTVVASSP